MTNIQSQKEGKGPIEEVKESLAVATKSEPEKP